MTQDIINFINDFFMLKYLPDLEYHASYGVLFLFGLLTSVHCIGMCGGIVISQCTGAPKDEPVDMKVRSRRWLLPSSLYNLGRVISYTLVGALVGGLGQIISFQGVWKGIVPIAGGIFMIIMAVNLLGIVPALRRLNPRLPGFFAKKIFSGSYHSPLVIGLLTGLMPCGPLQMIQLYALGTGSVANGAVSMLIFSLGTIPVLFFFGAVNTLINRKHSKVILKASALLVLILGLVMIGRGLALSGVSVAVPHISVSADGSVAAISENVQKVTTNIKSDSFPPITVQKGIPVRWTIHADSGNLNKCNNAIVIPEYGIETNLAEEDTLVEFTPGKTGEFVYTCWMGMIKSKITVVEDIGKISVEAIAKQGTSTMQMQCADSREEVNRNMKSGMNNCIRDGKPTNDGKASEIVQTMESSTGKDTIAVEMTDGHTEKPANEHEYSGYLQDKHCFGLVDPEKDTLFCLKMKECEKSGYGIAVKTNEDRYTFLPFDQKGQELAGSIIDKSQRESGLPVSVKGAVENGMIKVTSIIEK